MKGPSTASSHCPGCREKQLKIDRLEEDLKRLKAQLRHQQRTAREEPFGSSTPSSKILLKPNAQPEDTRRNGGAKPGHCGHGRRHIPEAEITHREFVPLEGKCPHCGGQLDPRGHQERTVREVEPLQKKVIRYELPQGGCPHCHCVITARAPGVFPKALLGNRLLAHVAIEHFVRGLTLGYLSRQLGIGQGTLWNALHQLAGRFASVLERLMEECRRAPVKHADETGWREDGRNGYAWLFCTPKLSLFCFRRTRSGKIVELILGLKRLPGVLVVDRYKAYNRALCAIQYCYAHLLREVKDLRQEFPEEPEVARFAEGFAPLLVQAMQLRAQGLSPAEFARRALDLKLDIKMKVHAPAQHPGIQRIQNIFRENPKRLYHWAKNPAIPAENNFAERELRQLVIARKISYGSQSERGALTREILMSVLHTLNKRTDDLAGAFERALNALAQNDQLDPYKILFESG